MGYGEASPPTLPANFTDWDDSPSQAPRRARAGVKRPPPIPPGFELETDTAPATLPEDFTGWDPAPPKGATAIPPGFEIESQPPAKAAPPAIPPGFELEKPAATAPTKVSAYRPSLGRRILDYLGTTAPVEALAGTKAEPIVNAVGIYPSHEDLPAERQVLGHPERLITTEEARQSPVAAVGRGVLKGAGAMTSAPSLATMASAAATGGLLSPAVPAIGRLISLGFSVQMANDLVRKAPQLLQQAAQGVSSGDLNEFYGTLGQMGFDATILGTTAQHAAGLEPRVMPGVPGDTEANFLRAEQARARMESTGASPEQFASGVPAQAAAAARMVEPAVAPPEPNPRPQRRPGEPQPRGEPVVQPPGVEVLPERAAEPALPPEEAAAIPRGAARKPPTPRPGPQEGGEVPAALAQDPKFLAGLDKRGLTIGEDGRIARLERPDQDLEITRAANPPREGAAKAVPPIPAGFEIEQAAAPAAATAAGPVERRPGEEPPVAGPADVSVSQEPNVAAPEGSMPQPRAGAQTVQRQIEMVPRDQISVRADEMQPRRGNGKYRTNADQVQALTESMQERGFDPTKPLRVWEDPKTQELVLLEGHHRLEAAEKAGIENVPIEIARGSYEDAKAQARRSNSQMAPMGPMELAGAFQKEAETGRTPAEISKLYGGMKEHEVEDLLRLNQLDPYLQREIHRGVFDVPRAVALAKATERYGIPPEIQREAFQYVARQRDMTAAQFGKLLDTFAPKAVEQFGLDFGKQGTIEGTGTAFRGLAGAMDEFLNKNRDLERSKRRLQGFLKEAERMEREGRSDRNIQGTRRRMEAEVRRLQGELERLQQDVASGKVFKTLGQAIAEGKAAAGPEWGQEPVVSPLEAEAARPPAGEPTLAGMEPHVEAQREAAGEEQGRKLTDELGSPKADVSRRAGELERESPLFRDTEASGQTGLFAAAEPRVHGPEEPEPGMKLFAGAPIGDPDAWRRFVGPLRDLVVDEAQKVRESRELHEGLYNLDSQRQADVLRAVQAMKNAPGTARDYEAIYHWEENHQESLTPEQRAIHRRVIEPVKAEGQRIYAKLEGAGVPAEQYVHRVVQGRGGWLDRVMALAGKRGPGGGPGNVLSQDAPAKRSRTMMALEDPDGNRVVVAVKGGRVTRFENGQPTDLGAFRSGLATREDLVGEHVAPIDKAIQRLEQERRTLSATKSRREAASQRLRNINQKLGELAAERKAILDSVPESELAERIWRDKQGREWTFQQATTKEIEANTKLRYYHNALASSLTSYLELRRAERAHDFLEAYKQSPEFSKVAFERGSGSPPEGWRPVNLDQFRNYVFRPHEAEVLNHFAQQLHRDPAGAYEKIGNFLRTSIFFNPLIHIPNISVHWAVEKGLRGWLPDRWGASARAGLRAINAVVHQNADFLEALDVGAPLQSQRFATQQLNQLFFEKMARELETNPTVAARVGRALGYADPRKLVKAVYDFSGKATWVSNDIAFLQAAYEKVERGVDLREALQETGKHIPTYRLPTRIFDSTTLAKLMSNPNVSMFGAYHYGALRSYGEMVKSALAGRTAVERARGLDLLATVGLATFVAYPQVDKLLKALTGNKDAELRRAGAATFPYHMYLLAKGEESPTEVAESVVTPAVQFKGAVELGTNRDWRTGRRIYDPHADAATLAWQLAHKGSELIAPVAQAGRASEDISQAKKIGLSMLGVRERQHGAEKLARDMAREEVSQTAPTPELNARAIQRRQLSERLKNKQLDRAGLLALIRQGKVSAADAQAAWKRSQEDPLVYDFRQVRDLDDALRVWEAATPEEKTKLRPWLARRVHTVRNYPEDQQEAMRAKLQRALGRPPALPNGEPHVEPVVQY